MGSRTESIIDELMSEGEKFATESNQDVMISSLSAISGLSIPTHDYRVYTRNASNFITVVVFKTGGAEGSTVATLTIARDANNFITSVTKS